MLKQDTTLISLNIKQKKFPNLSKLCMFKKKSIVSTNRQPRAHTHTLCEKVTADVILYGSLNYSVRTKSTSMTGKQPCPDSSSYHRFCLCLIELLQNRDSEFSARTHTHPWFHEVCAYIILHPGYCRNRLSTKCK